MAGSAAIRACGSCGAVSPGEYAYCPKCGASIGPGDTGRKDIAVANPTREPSRKRRRFRLAVLGIVMVALAGTGVGIAAAEHTTKGVGSSVTSVSVEPVNQTFVQNLCSNIVQFYRPDISAERMAQELTGVLSVFNSGAGDYNDPALIGFRNTVQAEVGALPPQVQKALSPWCG